MVGNTCGQSDAQVDQCGGCCCCSCFCVPDQGELPVPSSEDPPLDVKAFFWKRFARLAPLWYLGNLLALPLFFYNVKQIFAPWHFWTGAVLSLPPVGLNMWVMCHPPAGHLWTISTMAFYLIFPAIFHRINRVQPTKIRACADTLFGVQFGCMVVSGIMGSGMSPAFGYWWSRSWPAFRLPVFVMGMLAARQV
jgi:hypothetical protein